MTDFPIDARAPEFKPAPSRRAFLTGGLVGAATLALPACTTGFGGYGLVDAVRQLLFLSSERAFAKLTTDGGYWDNAVNTLGLESFLGSRGNVLGTILTSALFKNRLQDAFADFAFDAADRAAPVVTDAVRVVGIQNAVALIRGGPTAATGFLRNEMGTALVDAMVPEVGQAMRLAQEPLIGTLLSALTGVDVPQVATTFSGTVNNVIWDEIGREEAAIRADPRSAGDPQLAAILTGSSAF